MILFPAIDLQNGKCVRLIQGDFTQETIYSDSPLDIARQWQTQGAEWLHVVDLNGAKTGHSVNRDVIIELAATMSIPIQVGGGIRTIEAIDDYLTNGVTRVILGTAAINDPELLQRALSKYGDKIAVSVDARDGKPTTAGWTESSSTDVATLIASLQAVGVKTVIYTDISKDGMLLGPNFEELQQVQEDSAMDVIASGGVTTVSDIEQLQSKSMYGAIVGKAIYENETRFQEMIEVLI